MKYTESLVTKITINKAGLDPISVCVDNYKKSQGSLTIELLNSVYSANWGSIGNCTLEQFVIDCDNDYLCKKLAKQSDMYENDYRGFVNGLKESIINERKEGLHTAEQARLMWSEVKKIIPVKWWFDSVVNHEHLAEIAGYDFWVLMPQKRSAAYYQLCSVLDAIKECFIARLKGSESWSKSNKLVTP